MKVTHLYHSGCLVELEEHLLLFDYYQGQLNLNHNKPLYVFVSHRHYDHYNPEIFKLNHPHIIYILSNTLRHKYDTYYVDIHQTYQIDDLSISTLLSTDEECAFIVQVENQTIYHAGDLHWWHWEGESQKDNEYQHITYQQEINSIDQPIDLACIVVDIRQEKNYLLGLSYFLHHVPCHYVLPIHYFGHYETTKLLSQEHLDNPYHAQILPVTHENQVFEIQKKEWF